MEQYTVAITDATFEEEVLQSDLPVLVDFWAPWCPSCQALNPVLEDYARDNGHRVKVAKLNVDEGQEWARRLGVTSIPTMVLFHRGEKVDQILGFESKPETYRILDSALQQVQSA
ncbi:thioredoxin 1 [Symbiobacterium terraclitae]|uniref:Thioredoxin n=1 Tax=Symbiobacterium terraclitae TaxID=557451 RepID=A0ABS4JX52_9FIRM|nr:thioredoxin [Symbiobacterium terraclitae]MBP2020110.1 thioredoxin 1 [Symbiobacterium terraclitae]